MAQLQLVTTSNVLGSRLDATNVVLSAAIDAERQARAAALATMLVSLLTGTNTWAGTNQFLAPVIATDPANRIHGTFLGNGAGLSEISAPSIRGNLENASVPAVSIKGVLPTNNIPGLDGSFLVSGLIPDKVISTNLARTSELLQAQKELTTAIRENTPTGLTVVSASSDDTLLTARGYALFTSLPSPPWSNGPTTDAPSARSRHDAVWTGEELIIWGGFLGAGVSSGSGSRFSPSIGTWLNLPTFGAPSARESHRAVWTGSDFIVWGGLVNGLFQNNGAKLNLSSQTWSPVQSTEAPTARANFVALWTGARMIIWGGRNTSGYLSDGKLYDPTANAWTQIPNNGAAEARHSAPALWTRDRMLVWGGEGVLGELNTGARLVLDAGRTATQWLPISTSGAPSARSGHTMIWTGTRMIVWGGKLGSSYLANGAIYDPFDDVWYPMTTKGAPSARALHSAVWTGKEMMIYGGENGTSALASGALYNPDTDSWQSLTAGGGPTARSESTGFWTGSEFLIFGGQVNGQVLSALQRVTPQPTWYFYRKP